MPAHWRKIKPGTVVWRARFAGIVRSRSAGRHTGLSRVLSSAPGNISRPLHHPTSSHPRRRGNCRFVVLLTLLSRYSEMRATRQKQSVVIRLCHFRHVIHVRSVFFGQSSVRHRAALLVVDVLWLKAFCCEDYHLPHRQLFCIKWASGSAHGKGDLHRGGCWTFRLFLYHGHPFQHSCWAVVRLGIQRMK